MSGTVEQIKKQGVIIILDEKPEIGDLFQIYRVVDEVEIIIGTGYIRKPMGPNRFKLQPPDGENGERGDQFENVQINDLVRKV